MRIIGVDTGGTFTDLVSLDDESGTIAISKVPSTPKAPAEAVASAVQGVEGDLDDVERITVGTTIGVNALLQRDGADVIFLTTAGFEDVPHIQRINRPHLYDIQWKKSQALVRRAATIGVAERIDHRGEVVTDLSEAELSRVVGEVEKVAIRFRRPSVAICFLFSYLNPVHEELLAAAIQERMPDLTVSLSSKVAPVWREYERGSTTIADAYIKPLVTEFSHALVSAIKATGIDAPVAMIKSNGGHTDAQAAAEQSASLALSGLSGGLLAGKFYSELLSRKDIVTLDMGGTSADVGVIQNGNIAYIDQYDLEFSLPILGSFIDLTTVGAGGSSIAGFDRGGLLRVGPESAGADPGPAAYGSGGQRATLTDANLVLGRLDSDFFLGGKLPLHKDLAMKAVEGVAKQLNTTVEDAALAIVRLANANMANAIRLMTVDRGLDHRSFALLAFGGAGPAQAVELATLLGMEEVLIPLNPGLTSAFGIAISQPRVDRRETRAIKVVKPSEWSEIAQDLSHVFQKNTEAAVAEIAREGYEGPVEIIRTVSMRYLGQNYEQEIPVPAGPISSSSIGAMIDGFHERHRAFYGYAMEGNICELAHLNVTALGTDENWSLPDWPGSGACVPAGERPVYFSDTGWLETPVYLRDELPTLAKVEGPAIIQEIDSTIVLHPDQTLHVSDKGVLQIGVKL